MSIDEGRSQQMPMEIVLNKYKKKAQSWEVYPTNNYLGIWTGKRSNSCFDFSNILLQWLGLVMKKLSGKIFGWSYISREWTRRTFRSSRDGLSWLWVRSLLLF